MNMQQAERLAEILIEKAALEAAKDRYFKLCDAAEKIQKELEPHAEPGKAVVLDSHILIMTRGGKMSFWDAYPRQEVRDVPEI